MNTQTTEAYRVVGELFGRLQDVLSFGELVMFKNRQFNSIVFKWTFHVHGEAYVCKENVSMKTLADFQGMESFARRLSSRWEAARQQKIEEARCSSS